MGYPEMILRFPNFKTRAVTLSFDDGKIEDIKMAEILNKYGIKCTFNLPAGCIIEGNNRVSSDELNSIYEGHEIACHAYTHPHLNNLDHGGIAYQIIRDREALEEKTGRIIDGFAYPFGLTETDGMIDCIKSCGIKYGRTTVATYNFELPTDFLRWNPTCWQGDDKIFELAERFFEPDDIEHLWRIKPLLFYIWGHSYEYADNWERLEKICKTVSLKENVWYATNMEIINYICAFNALRRSVNGKIVYNPTDIDVYVWANDKEILIKKGETINI